jgi:DNA-3-methyladenine glycosylase II
MNSLEIEKGVKHIYTNDLRLAKIIDLSGKCELKPKKDYYHAILRAITGQQLSIFVAQKIFFRFVNFFEGDISPQNIISAKDKDLRNIGLSWAKIKYVKDFSAKIISKEISLYGINKMSDEEIIKMLTKVKGIGVWTVQMLLIFTLGRLNILPLGDLALRRAAKNIYELKKFPNEKKLFSLSKENNWSPYNSIASWYLWKSLEL